METQDNSWKVDRGVGRYTHSIAGSINSMEHGNNGMGNSTRSSERSAGSVAYSTGSVGYGNNGTGNSTRSSGRSTGSMMRSVDSKGCSIHRIDLPTFIPP